MDICNSLFLIVAHLYFFYGMKCHALSSKNVSHMISLVSFCLLSLTKLLPLRTVINNFFKNLLYLLITPSLYTYLLWKYPYVDCNQIMKQVTKVKFYHLLVEAY